MGFIIGNEKDFKKPAINIGSISVNTYNWDYPIMQQLTTNKAEFISQITLWDTSNKIKKIGVNWIVSDNRMENALGGQSHYPDVIITQFKDDNVQITQEQFENLLVDTYNQYLNTEAGKQRFNAEKQRLNAEKNTAIEDSNTPGGWGGASNNKILILSRWHKIYIVDKKKMIVYKGVKILLSEAKRIERDKKKRV
jgi:hypothetical protein